MEFCWVEQSRSIQVVPFASSEVDSGHSAELQQPAWALLLEAHMHSALEPAMDFVRQPALDPILRLRVDSEVELLG